MYHFTHEDKNTGTNLVITAIQSNAEVPVRVAPLIIISTLLTHLCGGSAGREGAALQVGGSLSNFIAKILHFDDKDTRIMIMCGMSACFSALFGTPIAAAIFSMEVISVGVMYYAALVPCIISALIASGVAGLFNITPTMFIISEICELSPALPSSQFIEQLKVLESQYDELFNCVYYDHYENFMESLRNKECDKADIYFLDIEFGEVYGMDVAKIITRMNRNAGIVYITNYEEYAIKAFVCRPLGFIRKKHDTEDIKVTMDKIISYMNDKNVLYTFKNNRNTLVLNLSTVLYIEMSNHDMNIYMTDDCRVVRDKISRVEKELAAKGFVKINRSSLVNMEHIVNIKDDEVIIDNGTKLYITGNKQEMIIRDWQAYIMGYSEQ